MKTINEIMKITECSREQAEHLYNELTEFPEKLGDFVSEHLDIVNAFNADEIEVVRHFGYSRFGANILVKRIDNRYPTYLDGTPNYKYWKYCFDSLIDYVGESFY